jgi:hypothetical protein
MKTFWSDRFWPLPPPNSKSRAGTPACCKKAAKSVSPPPNLPIYTQIPHQLVSTNYENQLLSNSPGSTWTQQEKRKRSCTWKLEWTPSFRVTSLESPELDGQWMKVKLYMLQRSKVKTVPKVQSPCQKQSMLRTQCHPLSQDPSPVIHNLPPPSLSGCHYWHAEWGCY